MLANMRHSPASWLLQGFARLRFTPPDKSAKEVLQAAFRGRREAGARQSIRSDTRPHATHRQLQQDALILQVTIPHLANVLLLVDQQVGSGTRLQIGKRSVWGSRLISRGWGLGCLAIANLPTSPTVNSLLPPIPQRTQKKSRASSPAF
ncbi:hypothetical protein [Metapseudomonas boanensis]|uniref:Uncharacterized protein n=1 Tax=Metapseudomonas boanensis TaxID=2822138 RepID=A0ABS5XBT5_9GAMM|nr:hypothetical protein [Pseudomonas boanensis]MBT8764616.1 hypothetical protein [Pseudomonas boanensis]